MTNFKLTVFAMTVALSSQAGAQEQPLALNLVCGGGGNANSASLATIHSWDSDGNTGGATVSGSRTVGFEDEVAVQIAGADGKLRMPRSMLPPLHGGDNGWFNLKNSAVTPSEITASVSVNPINGLGCGLTVILARSASRAKRATMRAGAGHTIPLPRIASSNRDSQHIDAVCL
jgi:hypothetical protein